ncbi:MAG: hypothetical protein CM1200mP20_11670 [Pseudomonadota bacterium]|nr:MAG: hypothetical protein CM1200mP20_11670 [Pseudomonadota bacterium]
MDRVHDQFVDVFRQEDGPALGDPNDFLVDLWGDTLPADDASEKLAKLGFLEPERVLRLLEDVRQSRFYTAFPTGRPGTNG